MSSCAVEDNGKSNKSKNGDKEDSCEEQNISKKARFQRKVFTPRNSLLTDMVSTNQVNVLLSISAILYAFLVFCTVLYYIGTPQELWRDMRIMQSACNFRHFLMMWLSFNACALVVFQGFRLWAAVRTKINTKFADNLALVIFVGALVFMYVATPYAMLRETSRPITGLATMLEQVRISMKMYAFVRESVPRVLKHNPSKDGDQDLCPSTKHFIYFLFIPTIIYRDTYPQKQNIDWKYAGCMLFLLASCIIITYCIFTRFMVDIISNAGCHPLNLSHAALFLMGMVCVGGILMFLMFISVLHSWMNFGAEVTRFADREFYQDWWNSTSFDEYFRKWNIVVYDWLYTYIYIDSMKIGFGKNGSFLMVFVISAIVHEYLIAITLGYFYPTLMFDFLVTSMVLLFLSRRRKSPLWNIVLWGSLCFGWGKNCCLYCVEWYARANCERTDESFLDFFRPRSWDTSCHILFYS